jgi:6,7-dimethyl-8-ribityllumazine synthase
MPHAAISGDLKGEGHRIAIAATRFNSQVVEQLVGGALDGLIRHGVAEDAITVVRCPGAWELPVVIKRLAASGKYDAIIAVGAVIRGETPHFDYVAGESAKGIAAIALDANLPVLNAILTTDTTEQAMARAGGKAGNKGWEAAVAAIEMINLLENL